MSVQWRLELFSGWEPNISRKIKWGVKKSGGRWMIIDLWGLRSTVPLILFAHAHVHPTSILWQQANHFWLFFFREGEDECSEKQKLLSSQSNGGQKSTVSWLHQCRHAPLLLQQLDSMQRPARPCQNNSLILEIKIILS